MVNRKLDKEIEYHYENSKSALLLTGARQTGKKVENRCFLCHSERSRRIFECRMKIVSMLLSCDYILPFDDIFLV